MISIQTLTIRRPDLVVRTYLLPGIDFVTHDHLDIHLAPARGDMDGLRWFALRHSQASERLMQLADDEGRIVSGEVHVDLDELNRLMGERLDRLADFLRQAR